jgi:hypothetical protein
MKCTFCSEIEATLEIPSPNGGDDSMWNECIKHLGVLDAK